jgi:hypothetical protein
MYVLGFTVKNLKHLCPTLLASTYLPASVSLLLYTALLTSPHLSKPLETFA